MEYEWEDVPLDPTSVALANLKQVIGCACEDIPDIAWNGQYYCIRCRASDREIHRSNRDVDGSNREGSK